MMQTQRPDDTTAQDAPRYDGLPVPQRYYAAATSIGGIVLTSLDASSVHVALPEIARSLQVGTVSAVWIANAYSLTVLMLLFPMSALADRVGFKRVFFSGVLLCLVSALVAASSTSFLQLLCARVGQGVGSAMVSALFGGIVRNIYPLRLLGRGISINAMAIGSSLVLGPVIGSVIVKVASWQWIFLINLPIGLLVLLGVRTLPVAPTNKCKFDVVSALLSMAALGLFVCGLALVLHSWLGRCLLLLAVLLAVVLVRHARTQAAPMVPVDLLAQAPIGFAVASSALLFIAQMGTAVALPFFFLYTMQRDYLEIGLLMGGWPIGAILMAPVAGWLVERYSAALLCALGAGFMTLALLILLFMPVSVPTAWLLPIMVTAGVGFGFFQTPNNHAMLSSAPRHRSAAMGGMQSTTRVFGQSVGIAGVGVCFSLSATHGAYLALGTALSFASAGVILNIVRWRSEKA